MPVHSKTPFCSNWNQRRQSPMYIYNFDRFTYLISNFVLMFIFIWLQFRFFIWRWAPNTKDKSHGGVLLPITKDFISSEITELKTNCEIVWAEINITGTKKICVASYYRPPSDDGVCQLLDVNYGLQLYQAVGGVVLHLVFQLWMTELTSLCYLD
jgi:hypothetical protein